jgi:pyruvate/2-oxoacid:ferredoxin oxidoreductase alpha subunit/ferredoxin
MRKDVWHYFDTAEDRQDEELIALLERAICEGVYCGRPETAENPVHLFGRSCERFHAGHFSALAGLAVSGLRTAAFPEDPRFLDRLALPLAPMVFHLPQLPENRAQPFFRIVATNAQEAIDWTLMAHKIAELSLVPGIVAFEAHANESPALLHNDTILQFLGSPDDWIPAPTPAQRMVFGKHRRRVPNWYHFDLATMLGAFKDKGAGLLQDAAYLRFFSRHLPDLIHKVTAEFSSFSARSYAAIQHHELKDADYLILAQGAAYPAAKAAVDRLRRDRLHVGCIHINLVDPFPEAELAALLSGKKGLTVLQPIQGSGLLTARIRAAAMQNGKKAPVIFTGYATSAPTPQAIAAALRNMLPGGGQKTDFFLDIPFTKDASSIPQHEVLLDAISREYPGIEEQTLFSAPKSHAGSKAPAFSPGIPEAIRRHKDQGPPYSRLARFYHDTAVLYQPGQTEEAVADPFQALPVLPPETALYAPLSELRQQLPVLDTEKCTGCGACFVHCPHSALPPLVLKLEELLKKGMELAAQQGTPASSLTPLIKNLSRLGGQQIATREGRTVKVADVLPLALEKLAGQMNLTGEKQETARKDLDKLIQALGYYQGIATDIFFFGPESREKGSGELFSLSLNPHSCTACGVCVEVCPEDALSLREQTPELLQTYTAQFRLWEQLPDTAASTIDRMNRDSSYDPLASVMLSRYFYQSMAGGSDKEEGAPAKALLHLVTAITESVAQPHVLDWIGELDELAGALVANIHEKLSGALPQEDSTALRNALAEAHGKKMPLDELVSKMGGSGQHLQVIDTALLQRKIQLESNLKDLRWALADGPSGTGRARYGIVWYASGQPWMENYPYQPFNVPVWRCDPAAGMSEVLGLVKGQVRILLDHIRLVRRARLEVRDAYRPEIHDQQIAGLSWEDLDEKERRLLPPMLVVADAGQLSGAGLQQFHQLLGSEWPVKVILLNDGLLDPRVDPAAQSAGVNGLLLSAVMQRRPIVVQGNLAAGNQLYKGLVNGLESAGTALFHLLAPRPEKHNIPVSGWPELFKKALETRAFPVLFFEPKAGMAFLSEGFSLKGNPDQTAPFGSWLLTQRAWNEHAKSPEATRAEETALRQWKDWQELAGAISAFPEMHKSKTEAGLRKQFETDLAAAKADFEAQLKAQEANLMENVKVRLREKLLKLSNREV